MHISEHEGDESVIEEDLSHLKTVPLPGFLLTRAIGLYNATDTEGNL